MATLATVISSKTVVPLGFVATIIVGTVWLTDVRATAVEARDTANETKTTQITDKKEVAAKLDDVSARLSKMEGQLSIIIENLKDRRQ